MGCILGLDVGTRTIGVAQADLASGIVTPLLTVARQSVRRDVERLASLCRERAVEAIVVGLPPGDPGHKESRGARLARQVGDALAAATGLPVHYQDEGMTTVEAHERLRSAGLDERRRRAVIDQVAAVVILERWLRRA